MMVRSLDPVVSSKDLSATELVTCCMATRVTFAWGRAICVQFNNVQEGLMHGGLAQDMIPSVAFLFPENDLPFLKSEEVVVGDVMVFKEGLLETWDLEGLSRVEIVLDGHNFSLILRGEDLTFRYVFPTQGFLNEFLVSLGEDKAKN